MGARGRRVLVAVGAAVALALGTTTAWADRRVAVPTRVEAWYAVTPSGGVPGGPSVNPYPEGTLHVGVAAGREESRSYIALDLASVPDGATVTAATLVLPVDVDGGTRSPEAASVRVCRAAAPASAAAGSTSAPPPADCSLSTSAAYVAARSLFEADLGPLLDVLDGGLAIVPAAAGGNGTWHVAFQGGSRGPTRIIAELSVAEVATTAPAPPTPFFDAAPLGAATHPEFTTPAPVIGLGPPPSSAGGVIPTPVAGRPAPPRFLPVPAAADGDGFRYSVVFALPLVLLVGVPYFGHALTAPVPRRRVNRFDGRGGR